MALGSGWTEIGRASTGFNGVRLMIVYARLAGQDIAKNQSTIETHLDLADNHGSSSSYNTTFYVTGSSGWNGYWGGNTGTVLAGSFTVTHNDDGTASAKIDGRAVFGGVGKDTGWVSGTVQLPTIARASQPSLNSWPNTTNYNITAGQACTIHMNKKANFTHKIVWSFGNLLNQTAGFAKTSGIVDNVSWTPPVSMMSQISNAKSGWGSITVTTMNGSTSVGSKSVSFCLNQPSDAAPDIAYTIQETGTLADGVTKLSSLGVQPETAFNILSRKRINISGTPKYSSTLSKLYILINGRELDGTIHDNNASIEGVAPLNNGGGYFKLNICAEDSRGNVISKEVSMYYNDYRMPGITSFVPVRDSAIVNTGKAPGYGTSYFGNVGTLSNTLSGTITYNGTSHDVTLTQATDGTWSTNLGLTNVEPSGSYQIKLEVKDAVGYSTTYTATLNSSMPTLWIGEKTVRVRDHLDVTGSSTLNGLTISGSPYYDYKLIAFELPTENSIAANAGAIIIPGKSTGKGIDANCPSGYEFYAILLTVSHGFCTPVYPEYAMAKTSNIWARIVGNAFTSNSNMTIYFVVLYRKELS